MKLVSHKRYKVQIPAIGDDPAHVIEGKFYFYHDPGKVTARRSSPGEVKVITEEQEAMIDTDDATHGVSTDWIGEMVPPVVNTQSELRKA